MKHPKVQLPLRRHRIKVPSSLLDLPLLHLSQQAHFLWEELLVAFYLEH
jgi:hypothetical protein